MAQNNKNTLQIKAMKGVDRFVKGTAREPDVFNDVKNMYVPNPGELTSLNGVTKLNVTDLPNVESISHIKTLETEDEKRLIVFYNPDTSILPDVDTNITVTSRGAGTDTRDLIIQYVSGGGGLSYHEFTGVDIGTTRGSTISFGGAEPGPRVRSINFFVKSASGTYLWSGSVFRRPDGTFPSESVIYGAKNDITGQTLEFYASNVNTGTEEITLNAAHGLQTGTPMVITTDGQIPTATGLAVNQTVYMISVSASVIKLANSYADAVAGTAFNFTAQGSGKSFLRVTALANTLAPQRFSASTSYDANASLQGNLTVFSPRKMAAAF